MHHQSYLVVCSQVINLFLINCSPEVFTDVLHYFKFILEARGILCESTEKISKTNVCFLKNETARCSC